MGQKVFFENPDRIGLVEAFGHGLSIDWPIACTDKKMHNPNTTTIDFQGGRALRKTGGGIFPDHGVCAKGHEDNI